MTRRSLPLPLLPLALVLASAHGCGGGTAQGRPEGHLPRLQELAVYDVPLAAAPETVQRTFAAAQGLLEHRPAPPSDNSMAVYELWATDVLTPWLREHAARLSELAWELEDLRAGEARDQLFASVVYATLMDDFAEQVRQLPEPEDVDDSAVARSFRWAVLESSETMVARAVARYATCETLALSAPAAMRAWADLCVRRAAELEARSEPPAVEAALPPVPEIPAECLAAPSSPDLGAPPPDRTARAQVVVVYDGDRWTGRDRARLLGAVTRRITRLLSTRRRRRPRDALASSNILASARVMPRGQVRRAERIQAQGRLTARGPVCAEPPSLPSVLARQSPDLVFARLETECSPMRSAIGDRPDGSLPAETCDLRVRFERGGSGATAEVAPPVSAPLDRDSGRITSWIGAARRLRVDGGSEQQLQPVGASPSSVRAPELSGVLPLDYQDDDPTLGIVASFRGALGSRFSQCASGRPMGSYDLRWTVTAGGRTESVEVTPRNVPGEGAAEAAACVAEALRASAWPCTASGEATAVEVGVCVGSAGASAPNTD